MVTGVGGRRPSTKHVRATSVALACAVLCGLIAAWPGRGDTLEWEPTGGPYGGWVSSLRKMMNLLPKKLMKRMMPMANALATLSFWLPNSWAIGGTRKAKKDVSI